MRWILLGILFLYGSEISAQTLSYIEQDDRLQVFYMDHNMPVFELPLDQPFLKIGEATQVVKEHIGSFKFKKNKWQREYYMSSFDTIILNDPEYRPTGSTKPNWPVMSIKGVAMGKEGWVDVSLMFVGERNALSYQVIINDSLINRVEVNFLKKADEHFFGGGEQFSHFDLNGHIVPFFSQEQGIGRGDRVTWLANLVGAGGDDFTTYAAMPYVITTEQRAMLVGSYTFSSLNLKKDDITTLHMQLPKRNYARKEENTIYTNEVMLWQAENPLQLTELYTQHIGRMPELPDWAYGTWLGLQGGAERVRRITDQALGAGNPVTGVWIQDWVGKRKTAIGSRLWWNWVPDEQSYPDIKAFNRDMNQRGIRMLAYINPYLASEGEMLEEAKEKDHLILNEEGRPYELKMGGFKGYILNLAKKETADWIQNVIETNIIDNGFEGWMADFAEGLPMDCQMPQGHGYEANPVEFHNEYPEAWATINRNAVRAAGKEGEIVFFSRSGFIGSPAATTLFWTGDQMHNYGKNDGLRAAICALNTSGISGMSLNHTDIGGYTTVKFFLIKNIKRSRDLFYRWTEMEAFTPIFRTHEGLKPEMNVQPYTDSATVHFFARMGRIHFALKPYFKVLVKEAATKGYPVIRHLYLHYPDDPETYNLKWQFLVGPDLLVIPTVKRNSDKAEGYFPEGEWKNIWTDKTYSGKQYHTVDAPYGQPAVFIKQGGAYERLLAELLDAEKF